MTTIGVAIAVPDPWGRQLQDYRIGLGDEQAQGIPTHVTLMPPFEVAVAELPVIEQHLAEAAALHAGFRMHLRGTGTFRPVSPVVFAVVVEGISQCEMLAESVRSGPLDEELKFPYHPHVTVAHDLDDDLLDKAFDDLAGFECLFDVDHFWLYVHDDRRGWSPSRRYLLATPEA